MREVEEKYSFSDSSGDMEAGSDQSETDEDTSKEVKSFEQAQGGVGR